MSTAVELCGFALLALASFTWASLPLEVVTGFAFTGCLLLLIGYAADDRAAVVAIGRVVTPVRAGLARRKSAHRQRRAARSRETQGLARELSRGQAGSDERIRR